jgi:hypothetical protein
VDGAALTAAANRDRIADELRSTVAT